ncbi:hypothetical protein [Acinetobacter johnsonii]|uniref:hypothetical protein n=1 Tax=Acinetobacter johnsonii TaxID=40214 RepID=UPI00102A2CEC|nr:hypothetical protein [Acinetobacter johnsonii]RZN95766.1 hypothetical protein EXE24_01160 [Acinetobacter johnsonii]
MTMKQTQTKMFDFADVGLDFCPGSKNLFPDRFKKMLSQGYNEQTVASVSVSGNQVTLNYGVAHGYVADRVLKVNSGTLAAINGGEFWIDAVTTNTLTLTIDGAPISVSGGFVTKIAPLGYQLVYEVGDIHVYKFKALDATDLYLRLVFTPGAANTYNNVLPCIGKGVDLSTGFIVDDFSISINKSAMSSLTQKTPLWTFCSEASSTYNNYSFSQGISIFGKSMVIGSLYHLLFCCYFTPYYPASAAIYGLVPSHVFQYEKLAYPLLIANEYSGSIESSAKFLQRNTTYYSKVMLGAFEVQFNQADTKLLVPPKAKTSFLPIGIDTFNTTVAEPISIYEKATGQFLGYATGIYVANYGTTLPTSNWSSNPVKSYDVDLNNVCLSHPLHSEYDLNASSVVYLTIPVEEIKIGA